MKCELVTAQTKDGIRLHGGLFTADDSVVHARNPGLDLLLFVHGVGSNFYQSSLLKKMVPVFQQAGISLLSVNTRGHDFLFSAGPQHPDNWLGSSNERISDCHLDLEAWSTKARKLGFARIALLGHSLGAIKAIYSEAFHPRPEIRAIVAASPSCLSCSHFRNSHRAGEFGQCLNWAQQEIESGHGQRISEVSFPFQLQMSPRTFVDKYGEEEKYNILRFIDRVDKPLRLSFGEAELRGNNPAFSDLDLRLQPLIMNHPSISQTILPDTDHYYSGMQGELAKMIISWFGSLPPSPVESAGNR
ncbi:MAG: hypothetical protein VX768_12755 [Planctomycetota bacterium]|nr:hypothetical protein [Planctomycetota bacterium]